MISFLVKKILCPTKLKYAKRFFRKKNIIVLDIGCGNRSCEITKHHINVKEYFGIDKDYWNNDKQGYGGIDNLLFMDLDSNPNFDSLKDNYFDLIIMNHVIEHLKNGELVLEMIYKKLKADGLIYIETPSIETLNFPSAIGFLNFYDDPTHKRVYEIKSLASKLTFIGFKVIKYGKRRDWLRLILFSPIMIIYNLFIRFPFFRKIDARGLWDLLGVACFVIATKGKK